MKTKYPKQAFDAEYRTDSLREVKFLADKGIRYVFVKKTRDYGISQFKYTKTPELFEALAEYCRLKEAGQLPYQLAEAESHCDPAHEEAAAETSE